MYQHCSRNCLRKERNLLPLGGDDQNKNDTEIPPPPLPPGDSSSASSSSSSHHNGGGSSRSGSGGESSKSGGSIEADTVGLLAGSGIILVGVFVAKMACERPTESTKVKVSSIEMPSKKTPNEFESGISCNASTPEVYHDESRYKIMKERLLSEEYIDASMLCFGDFRSKTLTGTIPCDHSNEPLSMGISNVQACQGSASTYAPAREPINTRISFSGLNRKKLTETAACKRSNEPINVRIPNLITHERTSSIDSPASERPNGPINTRISWSEGFRRKTHTETTACKHSNEPINMKVSNLNAHPMNTSTQTTVNERPNDPIKTRLSNLDPQMRNAFTDLDPDTFNIRLTPNVSRDENRCKIGKEGVISRVVPVLDPDVSYDLTTRDGNRYKIGNEGAASKLIPDVTSDISYDRSMTGMPFFESSSDISYDAPTFASSYDGSPHSAA